MPYLIRKNNNNKNPKRWRVEACAFVGGCSCHSTPNRERKGSRNHPWNIKIMSTSAIYLFFPTISPCFPFIICLEAESWTKSKVAQRVSGEWRVESRDKSCNFEVHFISIKFDSPTAFFSLLEWCRDMKLWMLRNWMSTTFWFSLIYFIEWGGLEVSDRVSFYLRYFTFILLSLSTMAWDYWKS